jgi:thiol-disulfide isomerase/thioredoxin
MLWKYFSNKIVVFILGLISGFAFCSLILYFSLVSYFKGNGIDSKVLEFEEKAIINEQINDSSAVVFDYWATWCKPCIEKFPQIEEAQKKYPFIKFILVSNIPTDSAKAFISRKGFNFHCLQINDADFPNVVPLMNLYNSKKEYQQSCSGYFPDSLVFKNLR